MVIQVEIQSGSQKTCVIEVAGRLDSLTYPQLETRFAQVDWQQTPTLVVDLKDLRHISSAGICCILKARRDGKLLGGKLFLMNLQPQVSKIFSIIKAFSTHEIFTSREEFEAFRDSSHP